MREMTWIGIADGQRNLGDASIAPVEHRLCRMKPGAQQESMDRLPQIFAKAGLETTLGQADFSRQCCDRPGAGDIGHDQCSRFIQLADVARQPHAAAIQWLAHHGDRRGQDVEAARLDREVVALLQARVEKALRRFRV